jgi:hypothetical protein
VSTIHASPKPGEVAANAELAAIRQQTALDREMRGRGADMQ